MVYEETYPVQQGDFATAGEASASIKRILKKLGVNSAIVRMVAVASYEAELNLIIHSHGGKLTLEVGSEGMRLISQDVGPGIADISLAMKEGYSTAPESVRTMGFGAGMGLPNIKRQCHEFSITSTPGVGTKIIAKYNL